jgi:WD40 repeat protein
VIRKSPYVGLVPYSEEDTLFFFGREREREVIAGNLLASRFTVFYGPSGVGKSSVLRAGVVPDLRKLARGSAQELGHPEFVVAALDSWRDNPTARLAQHVDEALTDALPGTSLTQTPPGTRLSEFLRARTHECNVDLLIILDQFEEYFLYHEGEEGEGALATELPRATEDPHLRVNFLVSIRDDALSKIDVFKGRISNLFNNYLRIEHLDRKAAKDAIERPVKRFNEMNKEQPPVAVEEKLVDALLDQVRTGNVVLGEGGVGTHSSSVVRSPEADRVETPYLQLVLERLWDEEMRAGKRALRLDTLNTELGGAKRIVQNHLETVMATLGDEEKNAAARVFQHLVTRSGTKIAYPVLDLAGEAGLDQALLGDVLEKLSRRDVRVLRQVGPAPGSPHEARFERYEIFHDVLASAILAWRTDYLHAKEREEAQRNAAREAAEHAKQAAQNRELELAREKAALKTASARLSRRLAVALGVAAVVAAIAAGFALKERSEARTQAGLATSRELANIANTTVDDELRMQLAIEAVRASRTSEAVDALQRALQEHRVVLNIAAHAGPVLSVLLTPDRGRLITTGAQDSTIKIWDRSSGQNLATVKVDGGSLALSVSPDGKRLAFVTQIETDSTQFSILDLDTHEVLSKTKIGEFSEPDLFFVDGSFAPIRISPDWTSIAALLRDGFAVWELSPSTLRFRISGADSITGFSYSRDGATLALGSATGRIWLRSAQDGSVISTLARQSDGISSVAFSPSGGLLITLALNGLLTVWEPGQREPSVTYSEVPPARSLAFSSDSTFVATASEDGVRTLPILWKGTPSLFDGTSSVFQVLFSPDGSRLATVSEDEERIDAWYTNGELFQTFPGHDGGALAVRFTPDGRELITGGQDGRLKIWSLFSEFTFKESGSITGLAYAASGRRLATMTWSNAYLWDTSTGEYGTLSGGFDNRTISSTPDGKRIAVSNDSVIRLFADTAQVELNTPPGLRDGTAAAFSPDGTHLASSRRGALILWNPVTLDSIRALRTDTFPVTAIAFSPDGQRVAAAAGGKAIIWNLASSDTTVVITHAPGESGGRESILDVSLAPWRGSGRSPQGEYLLATAGADGTARVTDAGSGAELFRVSHLRPVRSVSFSPDGSLLATASEDESVRLWEVPTGRERYSFAQQGAAHAVRFSPDGNRMAVGGANGVVRVYVTNVDTLLALARARALRPLTSQECTKYLHVSRCPGS